MAVSSPIETLRKPRSRLIAALFVFSAVVTIPQASGSVWGEALEITGFSLLIVAAMGRVWCAVYLSGRKDRELCREGPYSLSRNPLYFFSLVGMVGFFVALENLAFAAVAVVVYLGSYRHVVLSEEKRLRRIFGAGSESYADATPRFFPACALRWGLTSCASAARSTSASAQRCFTSFVAWVM